MTKLVDLLNSAHPEISDPESAVRAGSVLVDGRIVTNPDSLVRPDAAIRIRADAPLRGETKLEAALRQFGVTVDARVALDLGAAAGGFTSVLLREGARRVYAVDVGHGQLRGTLRQDPRVVDLERTNVSALTRELVPEPVDVVTIDLSYLSIASAASQIDRLSFADDAELIALVKPMFELGLGRAPTDGAVLEEAVARARVGLERAGWDVVGWMPSPARGARGAVEALVHARRKHRTVVDLERTFG